MSLDSVASALHPLNVVVWGEEALGYLGATTLLNSYMLIPSESEFDLAAEKLVTAGFRPAPWSYGIIDPANLSEDERARRMDPQENTGYRMLDDNSVRFQFPAGISTPARVVLLRSSYVGLSPPNDPCTMQKFHVDKNLHYPNACLLLESFVKTLLQDSPGFWRDTLTVWAIPYAYGMLKLDDTVLDSCEDDVRAWFNEKIRRGKGGLDRTTVSKRAGRRPAVMNTK